MATQPVLIDGQWRESQQVGTFQADNPATKSPLPDVFPVSSWEDCDAALNAAVAAFEELRRLPGARIAEFLNRMADLIDENKQTLCEIAHQETGLPMSPRLMDVELPRTSNQLRLAAQAAAEGSWKTATIDTANNIRSYFAPLGPVWVFGPNNFPFAFNSASGGDFAAAIAAGNPVIAKANSSHPATTRELAKLAHQAAHEVGLPPATVQCIYRTKHEDGERLVADPRTEAIGYTGSRGAGLKLKEAADKVGTPIYLELSSVNPVIILPGALKERGGDLAKEFQGSCLMGSGQFCTNPGMVVLLAGKETDQFIEMVKEGFAEAPVGTLLSASVEKNLAQSIGVIKKGGATQLAGGSTGAGTGYSHANTLLSVPGSKYLEDPELFQTEAFGNSSLLVIASDIDQVVQIVNSLEGNLTGSLYTDTQGSDDAAYATIAPHLRQKVGRLINDKMPTGVAVSAAMNHGGPFPATGHPGFTAVGIPAAIHRFAMLQSFDGVRLDRLPAELQNKNPTGQTWRWIDGTWTQADVS